MKTPYNPEAEQVLLGALLYEPTCLDDIADSITPRHFADQRHQFIFQAIVELAAANTPVLLTTLSKNLQDKGKLAAAGGPTYLAQVGNTMIGASNIRYWANLLEETFTRRNLLAFAQRLTQEAQTEPQDIQGWLAAVGKGFNSAYLQATAQGYRFAAEIAETAFAEIEAVMDGKIVRGLPTGIRELDITTGGLKRGELTILAGRPGQGKSALALTFAHAAASMGHTVALASMEMGSTEIMRRLISRIAEATTDCHARDGAEWKKIVDAVGLIHSLPLAIDDSAIQNIHQLRARARRLKREKNLELLIVDYLQLMEVEKTRGKNREQEVAELSRGLKILAKELDIPVVVLAQLNRGPETRKDGEPRMSDLRESGAIEQDADVVLFIWRPFSFAGDDYEESYTRLKVGKQRNGPREFWIPLQFDGQFSRFIPWTGKQDGKRL